MRLEKVTILLVLVALAGWCIMPVAAPAEQPCGDHDDTRVGGDDNTLSSPCIHKHREGVILPLGPTVSAIPLSSIEVDAEATFFSCMVRNFIVNVRAEFVVDLSVSTTNARMPMAFPITTHALYGDHNQFRDITISVDNAEIAYRVAMDYGVWSTWDGQLSYKGRVVNYAVHPLLERARDLRIVAPHLVAKGFDLVLYWYMPHPSSISNHIVIEYTSNSDDFSGCCHEVRDCAISSDPYHFYFDLSNARYWPGPTSCHVVLRDSGSAQWASVPMTDMATVCTEDTIELTSDASTVNVPLEDLAVPVQPAVFDCWPRRWPQPTPPPIQDFTVSWLGGAGGMIERAVIDRIPSTPNILVHADLPFVLDEHNPSEDFWACFMPPIPEPSYLDVVGCGYWGHQCHGLYESWLRVPLAGKCIMGHDLAVRDVRVIPGSGSSNWLVRATVSNPGLFAEDVVATLVICGSFVKSMEFGRIEPGDELEIELPVRWCWELPADVEVEVEPAPGEVLRMDNAAMTIYPPPPLPRHAHFVLQPDQSRVRFILSGITTESKLIGAVQLYLGDPDVPVSGAGTVGLSVDRADLVAPDFEPAPSATHNLPEPLYMFQAPWVHSTGSWNVRTGEIQFEMYLVTPHGDLPAQQPTLFSGRLTNAGLSITGLSSEPTAIPKMIMDIYAYEAPLPPPPDVWFSTEVGFHAGRIDPDAVGNIRYVSPGDLLSRRGHIVRTNHELTAHLGIMPMVPDLGLDAVVLAPRREIWFSFEEDIPRIWSETLGVWLKHGDLLSDRGYVVQTNERLLARFVRMPPVRDVGLDAVTRPPCRAIFFSTEEDFFSEALGVMVRHGDLLSNRGRIVRTNAQLMQNFNPINPIPLDFGLDAAILRPWREIWFSTEVGFTDANLGPISDGDLLSTFGYIVARNLDLVEKFGPIEDLANFGLDAMNVIVPSLTADFDQDGDVDGEDVGHLEACLSGPGVAQTDPDCLDALMDEDDDVDQEDLAVAQGCMSGANVPGDPDCGIELTATAWRSVRLHGGPVSDELAIEMDPLATGNGFRGPTVEPRVGGIQKIEVDFSQAVQLVPGANVEAVEVMTGTSYSASSLTLANGDMTLEIGFDPGVLPDETCYIIDLARAVEGSAGQPLAGDTECMVRSLAGDASGDGDTNLIDMALIKRMNGQPVFPPPPGYPDLARIDVNADGTIDLIDMALVKSLNGNSASCP